MKRSYILVIGLIGVIALLSSAVLIPESNVSHIAVVRTSNISSTTSSVASATPNESAPTTTAVSVYDYFIKNGDTPEQAEFCQKLMNEMKPGVGYNAIPAFC